MNLRILFSIFLFSLSFLITSCQTTTGHRLTNPDNDPILNKVMASSDFQLQINECLQLIRNGDLANAASSIKNIFPDPEKNDEALLLLYTRAKFELASQQLDKAYNILNNPEVGQYKPGASEGVIAYLTLLTADVLAQKERFIEAANARITLAPLLDSTRISPQENNDAIWHLLNMVPLETLKIQAASATGDLKAWENLNIIVRDETVSPSARAGLLKHWELQNPNNPGTTISSESLSLLQAVIAQQKEKIAILLPLTGDYLTIADAIRDGIMQYYYQINYMADIRFYDTLSAETFSNVYDQAVNDGATLIIGPLLKNQLEELYKRETLPVTTIALNKLDLTNKPTQLYEFSLAPEDEISSLIEYATQKRQHYALLLAQDNDFSSKSLSIFSQLWLEKGNKITASHRLSYSSELTQDLQQVLNIDKSMDRIAQIKTLLDTDKNDIDIEANPNSRTDIDSIFIFAKADNSIDISQWLDLYFPDSVSKYATSSIYRGFPEKNAINNLNNIIFSDMNICIKEDFSLPSDYKRSPLIRMFAFGMDALHAALVLKESPDQPFGFDGETGYVMQEGQIFYRKMSLATFSHGQLIPINLLE